MSTSSKSPRKVTLVALNAAKESLPEYAHPNSPRKFTLHQLFACLVLKRFLKLDYRGIHGMVTDCSDMQRWLGLKSAPHFTTLQQAHRRLLGIARARDLLQQTVEYGLGRRRQIRRAITES